MSDTLSLIDPSSYSTMDIIEPFDEEVILDQRMRSFKERWIAHDPPFGAAYDLERTEFDPAVIVQESCTIYHGLLLNRVNQAARACTLAFATGRDLDTIASRYPGGVPRVASEIYDYQTALPPERKAKDDRYRERIWMSPFKLARGATSIGYRYDAMTAIPDARDVAVRAHRTPEQVSTIITLLMNEPGSAVPRWDNPRPTPVELKQAYVRLDVPEVVENTDVLGIEPCTVLDRHYKVNVFFHPFVVDRDEVLTKMSANLAALLRDKLFYLGRDHGEQEIKGACNLYGVHHVVIDGFDGDVQIALRNQVIRATHECVSSGVYRD